MSRDPKFSMPEHAPITYTPEHRARMDAAAAARTKGDEASDATLLADVRATARRIGAAVGTSTDTSVYGDHCVNCDARWCLPADKASCAHMPICEDCWPNGCPDCEREVEEGIRRREEARVRIVSAVLELRTGADDLSETDLRSLDWRDRQDVLKHADLAIEALRRVVDVLNAQNGEKA